MLQKYHSTISGLAKLFNIDVLPIITVWNDILSKRRKTRGKKDTIKFLKELNTVSERYALYQTIEAIPWTISDNDNFPKVFKVIKPYLRSENSLTVVFALSVTRSVEALRLPISKDLDSVIAKSTANTDIVKEVINFIPEFLRRTKIRIKFPEMKYHLSIKNGPNGHALKTSDSDISAVMRSPKLFGAIQTVQEKLTDKSPMIVKMKDIISNISANHSKLTQFPEKAGKTRTIAIIDYYSQRCLKPLHEGLMKILHRLESDGTYSHFNVGKYAQNKTKDKSFIYCADLTAATDRFPAEIQRVLLQELIQDPGLSDSLWTLLAKRTFTVSWSGEKVTYNCGQPMGAYGSWPLFALAHHLVVEYSAYKAHTRNPKRLYRLIGDDVIITDRATAVNYKQIMEGLGLTINASKTVVVPSASDKTGAEVAKMLFLNGRNITPLTPGFIRDLGRPYSFNMSMKTLINRYNLGSEYPSTIIDLLFRNGKAKRLCWLLSSDPLDGVIKPSHKGYDESSPWMLKDIELVKEVNAILRFPKLQEAIDNLLRELDSSQGELSGKPWTSLTPPSRAMPFVIEEIKSFSYEIYSTLNPEYPTGIQKLVDLVPYIPDPSTPYRSGIEMKCRTLASFKEQVFLETPGPWVPNE